MNRNCKYGDLKKTSIIAIKYITYCCSNLYLFHYKWWSKIGLVNVYLIIFQFNLYRFQAY